MDLFSTPVRISKIVLGFEVLQKLKIYIIIKWLLVIVIFYAS